MKTLPILTILAIAGCHGTQREPVEQPELEQAAAPPAQEQFTEPTVKISYWLVLAEPDAGSDAKGLQGVLAPTLARIEARDGAAAFSVVESASISSQAGGRGKAKGRHANIEQRILLVDGNVVADIDVDADRGSGFETRVALTPGEVVVLGHAGRETEDDEAGRLYYIARAET